MLLQHFVQDLSTNEDNTRDCDVSLSFYIFLFFIFDLLFCYRTIFDLAGTEAAIGAGSSRHLELIAPGGVIIPSRAKSNRNRAVRLAVGEER